MEIVKADYPITQAYYNSYKNIMGEDLEAIYEISPAGSGDVWITKDMKGTYWLHIYNNQYQLETVIESLKNLLNGE